MKQYEFHSALPPEEVFVRLGIYSKPFKGFSPGDKTFRYERRN